MGLGWFNVSSCTSFYCAINKWPSSTRAELAAIWTALLTIPSYSTVQIYTDSAAAIQGITNALAIQQQAKWAKLNNITLLQHIRSCITSKHLTVSMHKVKGHSDNYYNDLADNLAKGGLASEFILDLDFTRVLDTGGQGFYLSWRDLKIDINYRQFIKSLQQTHWEASWSTSCQFRETFSRNTDYNTADLFFAHTASFSGRNCNSWSTHYLWSFCLKLFSNSLPTQDKLIQRKHTNFNWTCAGCMDSTHTESLSHLLTCKGYIKEWNAIIDLVTEHTINFAISKDDITISSHSCTRLARTLLSHSAIMDSQNVTLFNRRNWLLGTIDSATKDTIKKTFRTSRHTNSYIIETLILIKIAFKSILWKSRCSKQKELEKSVNVHINRHKHKTTTTTKCKIRSRPNTHSDTPPVDVSNQQPIHVLDDIIEGSSDINCTFKPDRIGWTNDQRQNGITSKILHGFSPGWMTNMNGLLYKQGKSLAGKLTGWFNDVANLWHPDSVSQKDDLQSPKAFDDSAGYEDNLGFIDNLMEYRDNFGFIDNLLLHDAQC